MPEINSRRYKILLALVRRPMTIYQGEEDHGNFATAALPDGIDHAMMTYMYADLVERNCLIKTGIVYRVSISARDAIARHFAGRKTIVHCTEPAQARPRMHSNGVSA